MTIEITSPEVEALIQQRMRAGSFRNPQDLILAALRSTAPDARTGAMYLPTAAAKRPQINAAIRETMTEFAPSVRRINYSIAQDWDGQWALFLRVLLSNEASERNNLREVVPRVISSISDKLDIPALGLFPYFDFRSEGEQAKMNDPAWA